MKKIKIRLLESNNQTTVPKIIQLDKNPGKRHEMKKKKIACLISKVCAVVMFAQKYTQFR